MLISRHTDGEIYVNYNRCAHKGTRIAGEQCGKAGEMFTCPYHGWAFRTDGSLLSVPLRKGYDGTGFEDMPLTRGLTPVKNVAVYRDFIFVKLNDGGPDFESFFGESLSTIDNMVDRSPEGRLVVEGAPLRYMHRCNWKMLVENQTDTCHPMVAHESSAGTGGGGVGRGRPQRPAPARRAAGAVLQELRVLRRHGHPGLAERARPYRRHRLDSCRLFGNPGLLGEDGGRLRGGAGRRDPGRDPS